MAAAWRGLDALRPFRTADDTRPATGAGARAIGRRGAIRAAAGLGIAAMIGGGWSYSALARETAATGIGERRTVRCGRGLSAALNTDSAIAWRAGRRGDTIWLERGEAAFGVEPVSARPARLETAFGAFDLAPGLYNARLGVAGCDLTVLRGAASAADHAIVRSGDGALATRGGGVTVLRKDMLSLERIRAWRRGDIVLAGESLDYAVAEYNRYLVQRIVIGDPALSRLRIGGTFAANDPDGFLRAIQATYDVRAKTDRAGTVILTQG